MKIFISLTTTPKRIYNIEGTIQSLVYQTVSPTLIILNVPYQTVLGETYNIPDFLARYSDRVYVNRCTDSGPITKLLPTILMLQKLLALESSYIMTVDDDLHYPENMVENYVSFLKQNPETVVVGNTGMGIKQVGGKTVCEIIEGYGSVVYKSKQMVNLINFYNKIRYNTDCIMSDDLIVSNYCVGQNYTLYIMLVPEWTHPTLWVYNYGLQSDALHRGGNQVSPYTNIERYRRAKKYLEENGLYYLRLKNL